MFDAKTGILIGLGIGCLYAAMVRVGLIETGKVTRLFDGKDVEVNSCGGDYLIIVNGPMTPEKVSRVASLLGEHSLD